MTSLLCEGEVWLHGQYLGTWLRQRQLVNANQHVKYLGWKSLSQKVIVRAHARLIALPGLLNYCYYYNRFMTLCLGLPGWVGTRRINHSGFCWSRDDGVAVVGWLVEQCLTSHQTHYSSYRGHVSTGQMTQPTMSQHWRTGRQWHQLNHMQAICTSLQKTTIQAPHQSDFYGPDALPDTQPTASKHWRQHMDHWNGW